MIKQTAQTMNEKDMKVYCHHCGGEGGAIGSGLEDGSGEPCHAGPYRTPIEEVKFDEHQSVEHHEQAEILRGKGFVFIEYDEYGQEVWGPPQP